MKQVFLDTNILLETIFDRKYKFACEQVLLHGQKGDINLLASYLTFANMAYIMQKNGIPRAQIYGIEQTWVNKITVLPMDGNQLKTALRHEVKDFEDMLQYQSAVAGQCDCIVTINVDDFKEFSAVPVYSPDDLLDLIDEDTL